MSSSDVATLQFFPRYMTAAECSAQYKQQLLEGRPPAEEVVPSAEEIMQYTKWRKRGSSPEALVTTPISYGKHKLDPVIEATRYDLELPISALRRRWTRWRQQELNLENIVRTAQWPNLFRFVTPSAQRAAITQQALAASAGTPVPPARAPLGAFRVEDLLQFYPPIIHRDPLRPLPEPFAWSRRVIEGFCKRRMGDVESFMMPVDEIRHGAPKYYETIQKPIDIASILARIDNQLYPSVSAIKQDLDTMWQNCRQFNPENHWLHKLSIDLESDFNRSWGIPPAPTPPPAPRLPVPPPRGSATAKLFARLERMPFYSGSYLRVAERLGLATILVAEICPDDPSRADVIVRLVEPSVTNAVADEVFRGLERGEELEQRKVKLIKSVRGAATPPFS
eukprot:Sspe_Gene.93574::Locus_66175_Transcript_1_2_Confidence_0.500_Length_1456::g.93574::m.93574